MCVVTDASTPPLPLQSVAAYRLWHDGNLYDDWSAAGLATSDDVELQAIARGVLQAAEVVGHSHALTARLTRCVTGHAERVNLGESANVS